MQLNSFSFLLFFLMVWAGYLLLPFRRQNFWLLVASYSFYCFWDYRFLVLILVSTSVDFWVARRMAATGVERRRRNYLFLSLAVNIAILGFFKYFNFFLDSAHALLGQLGLDGARWHLNIVLPIGISFYTFKSLSYTIDVYGRAMAPACRWIDYATFVAFFPQLLSGPIDRASALLPQIENPRKITRDLIRTGIWLFFWGLFKKVVVADNIAEAVGPALYPHLVVSAAHAWTTLYGYAMQLYCDFSGYTDMARGVAMLLGFQTTINFRNPFFASNPVDFWQRWHISLSKWIQDYVYFPMAAHALRKSMSAWNQYMPHIYTMALIGLWHGANLTYIVFGVYWGLAIVAYNLYRTWMKRYLRRIGRKPENQKLPIYAPQQLMAMAILFHVVCLGLVFFRADSLGDAFHFFRLLFDASDGVWLMNGFGLECLNIWLMATLFYGIVFIVQIHQEIKGDLLSPLAMTPLPRIILYITITIMLLMFGKIGSSTNIYANF